MVNPTVYVEHKEVGCMFGLLLREIVWIELSSLVGAWGRGNQA